MLGINEGTSKSQLSHARKILQQQVIKKSMSMEPNNLELEIKLIVEKSSLLHLLGID
jgi:hypothetical protein